VVDYSTAELTQESFTSSDTDIAFSPNAVALAMIAFVRVKNLSMNWLSKYVGKQTLDNSNNDERSLDAFFTNDIRISYSVQPRFFKSVELNLLLNNIFNEMYEPNGYTFSYYVPGERQKELVTENYYYPM